MKKYFILFLKGAGMGSANIIPGVSGGTIALICGIYKELIDSVKSFDLKAIKLLFGLNFKELVNHVNLLFLITVFTGAVASIFLLAGVLNYLFINYPVFVWAFFFGLILGSVFLVAARIEKFSVSVISLFAISAFAAIAVSVLNPATENDAYGYLLVCGVVAMSSMILPGLSGSFILILMGNYQLVMIDGVRTGNLHVLVPFLIGCIVGIIALSHFLSWLFKKFRNQTLGLLTGFMFGSLAVLWPWKYTLDVDGNIVDINRFGAFIDNQGNVINNIKAFGYRHAFPDILDVMVLIVVFLMLLGFVMIWSVQKLADRK